MNIPQKSKTLIDHFNEICVGKTHDYFNVISDEDKKSYNVYILNRLLSMNAKYAPFINEIQTYNLSPEAHYRVFSDIIPKKKQYNKYITSDKNKKYSDWLVDIISTHYKVSRSESVEYINIYYKCNKEGLRTLCSMYGIDPKLIKKEDL